MLLIILKNYQKVQTRRFVYFLIPVLSNDVISQWNQTIGLFVLRLESGVKINIWDPLSAA